jgi:hypothetical protein
VLQLVGCCVNGVYGSGVGLCLVACSILFGPDALADSRDITESLLTPHPAFHHPEITNFSADQSLSLALPDGRMREIYEGAGFAGCEPQPFYRFYEPASWSESGRYCLERAKEVYRSQAFRLSLTEPENFGNVEHPSGQTKADVLFQGIPERVFQRAAETFASRGSSLVSAILSGQLSYEVPLGSQVGATVDAVEEPSHRVRYVVKRTSSPVGLGPRLASTDQGDAVRMGLGGSKRGGDAELDPSERVSGAGGRPVMRGSDRRLVEVIEPAGASSDSASSGGVRAEGLSERPFGLREKVAARLGLSKPVFTSVVARIDRAGANQPDGVSFSLAEGSASLLFAEVRPLAQGDAGRSLSYGFVLPWHAFALRVQHFKSGALPVYQVTHVTPQSNLKLAYEETTEKINLEFSCVL